MYPKPNTTTSNSLENVLEDYLRRLKPQGEDYLASGIAALGVSYSKMADAWSKEALRKLGPALAAIKAGRPVTPEVDRLLSAKP
jgi:hypothetical protein